MYTGMRNIATIIPWDWPLCSTGPKYFGIHGSEDIQVPLSPCGPLSANATQMESPLHCVCAIPVCTLLSPMELTHCRPLSSPSSISWQFCDFPASLYCSSLIRRLFFIYLYTVHPSRSAHWKASIQTGWSQSPSVPSLHCLFFPVDCLASSFIHFSLQLLLLIFSPLLITRCSWPSLENNLEFLFCSETSSCSPVQASL